VPAVLIPELITRDFLIRLTMGGNPSKVMPANIGEFPSRSDLRVPEYARPRTDEMTSIPIRGLPGVR
jgi:hypothetical protein